MKEDNETGGFLRDMDEANEVESWKLNEEDSAFFVSHLGSDFEDWLKEDFSWWEIKKINWKAWWKARKYKKQLRKEQERQTY